MNEMQALTLALMDAGEARLRMGREIQELHAKVAALEEEKKEWES